MRTFSLLSQLGARRPGRRAWLACAAAAGLAAAALALGEGQPVYIAFVAGLVAFAAIIAAIAFLASMGPARVAAATVAGVARVEPTLSNEPATLCEFGRAQWRLVTVDHNWGTKQVSIQIYLPLMFPEALSDATVAVYLRSLSSNFGQHETKQYQWRPIEARAFAKGESVEIVLATIPENPDMQGFCGAVYQEELLWIWAPSKHCFGVEVSSVGRSERRRIMIDLPSRALEHAPRPFSPFAGRLFVQEEDASDFDEEWARLNYNPA